MLTSRGRKLQVRVVSLQSAQHIGTLKCYTPAHNPCVGDKGDVPSITYGVGRVILPADTFRHMWLLDQTRLILSEDRDTRPREPAGNVAPRSIRPLLSVTVFPKLVIAVYSYLRRGRLDLRRVARCTMHHINHRHRCSPKSPSLVHRRPPCSFSVLCLLTHEEYGAT